MKRILTVVLVLSLMAAIFAGGSKDGKKAKVTICGTNGPGDTQSMAHEEFAKRLNATGNWDADSKVSSEMGSTDDVTEAARQGAPLIAASDPSRIASFVPEFGVLMMPYLLDSYAQLDNLMDTPLYKKWEKEFEAKGIKLLTNNCLTGFRHWVTNKEINGPADLKGLKIRTMGNAIAVDSVNAMGGIATPMNQSEAYNGISSKALDGGEWQIPTIYSAKFFEVCKNISLSNHFLLTGSIVTGTKFFDALPAPQQKELKEIAVKNYKDNQAVVAKYEKQYLDQMVAAGVKVTTPNTKAFVDATAPLYAKFNYTELRTQLYKELGITK